MSKPFLQLILAGVTLFLNSANAGVEVARVNEKVITIEEVKSKVAEATRMNPLLPPSRKQVLDDLIKREVAIQEAKRTKLDQDPVAIERMNNALYTYLIEKKIGSEFEKMTLSEAEARNWYQKNPEVRSSHIFIALPPDTKPEEEAGASKRLTEILGEIKAGKYSFAEAAQRFSEDPSAALGGDLDYRMKDRLDPTYYRALLKIGKIGDIAGPVKTPFGLHLIRLTGKQEWIHTDRNKVKALILDDRRQELVNRVLNGLREKARVSINEKALRD